MSILWTESDKGLVQSTQFCIGKDCENQFLLEAQKNLSHPARFVMADFLETPSIWKSLHKFDRTKFKINVSSLLQDKIDDLFFLPTKFQFEFPSMCCSSPHSNSYTSTWRLHIKWSMPILFVDKYGFSFFSKKHRFWEILI